MKNLFHRAALSGPMLLAILASGCVIPWSQPGGGGGEGPGSFTLTAVSNPAGGGSVLGGGTYSAGSPATLTAQPAPGFRFSFWRGSLSGLLQNPIVLTMDEPKSVTACFFPLWYGVVATVNPLGGGTVSGPAGAAFLSTLTLTAVANPDFAFSGWTGDFPGGFGGTGNPAQGILMDQPAPFNVTANFRPWPWHTVTVTPSDPAMGSASGGGYFPSGASATLSATALAGYRFTCWVGGGLDGKVDNPVTFVVGGPKTVTAQFSIGRPCTVATGINLPGAGTVTGGGTYIEGRTASLSASANYGYDFAFWSGVPADQTTANPVTIVVTGDKTVTANFTPQKFLVNTLVNIPGAGSVSGGGYHDYSSIPTLTATPSPGYAFSAWTGGLTGTMNPRSITVDGPKTVTANFVVQPYPVAVEINPPGAGTVSGGGDRTYGTSTSLEATPNPGYLFSGWTGDLTGAGNPQPLLVDGPRRVTANFSITAPRTLSVAAFPAGAGSVGGGGRYPLGASAVLTALPVPGFEFSGWSGDALGTSNPVSVSVTGDLAVTAEFRTRQWNWTWMGGPQSASLTPGVYGTLGVPNPANHPGGRIDGATWTDLAGNLWLFGGWGPDGTGTGGVLNDLWRFNPATLNWTWMGGSNLMEQPGVYGVPGGPRTANIPGGRYRAAFHQDGEGNLYLFGGYGVDGVGMVRTLNDFWRFDGSRWTWLGGSDRGNQPPVYGPLGVPDPANRPGARERSSGGVDGSGNFTLFGGLGQDGTGNTNLVALSDLWRFDGRNWTWVSGPSTGNLPGSFGSLGVPDPANIPRGTFESSFQMAPSGRAWYFGGMDVSMGVFQDLWEYDGQEWACLRTGAYSGFGEYGVRGAGSSSTIPGERYAATSLRDALGMLCFFGGYGGADRLAPTSYTRYGQCSDLWRFDGTNWIFVGGYQRANQDGAYGTLGVPFDLNSPGGRMSSLGWTDSLGGLWVFGGGSMYGASMWGDLWRFAP